MNLMDKMRKAGSIKSTTLADSYLFNEKEFVPTRVPIINVALSGKTDGGLTNGLTFLAGPSKHFKSLLGLILIEAYLKKHQDAVCLFYDSEFGITPKYIEANGIDPNRMIHIPIEHLEQLKFDIAQRLAEIQRGDKVIIFIDSVGNLASKKEAEDALKENTAADMTRAKVMKSLWRIVTPHLTTKDIPLIAVNHTYQTMEMYAKNVMSGGCLVENTKIKMYDGSYKNIQEIEVNDLVATMNGPKPVTHTWNPETLENGTPNCFKITFDDDYSVICSDNHPFLTTTGWVNAKNLNNNMDVVCF